MNPISPVQEHAIKIDIQPSCPQHFADKFRQWLEDKVENARTVDSSHFKAARRGGLKRGEG